MGKGGNSTAAGVGNRHDIIRKAQGSRSKAVDGKVKALKLRDPLTRPPVSKPPFTISDIRALIPAHCFNRSILTSLFFLAKDIVVLAFLVSSTRYYDSAVVPSWAPLVLWPLYWVCAGCVGTGLWMLGHECGHHAFSDSLWVDNSIGLAIHSFLLVPFFSWKYSHSRHHSRCADITGDTAYVPQLDEEVSPFDDLWQIPAARLGWIVAAVLFGWPLYLITNFSGQKYDTWANHFAPSSPVFKTREKLGVMISDISLLVVLSALIYSAKFVGATWLLMTYVPPLLIVNAWLITITYLQHTHPAAPHYKDTEWDWLRGTLSTYDRDYGVLNNIFHHITDTHVVHHLFSSMPFYHALEATNAVKPLLGEYYNFDTTNVFAAMWREARECNYITTEPDSKVNGVFWFHQNTKEVSMSRKERIKSGK